MKFLPSMQSINNADLTCLGILAALQLMGWKIIQCIYELVFSQQIYTLQSSITKYLYFIQVKST